MQESRKICTKCKIEKYSIEFSKNKLAKDGLKYSCKVCDKKYQLSKQEEIAENKKAYYQANKEKLAKHHREYYQANREEIANQKKEYYNNNQDTIAKSKKIYSQTDGYKATRKNLRYKRRSLTKQGDATGKQILELEQKAKICYWCNKPLKNKIVNVDHYDPLAKGGEHTLSNLVVSCRMCNLKKHAKDPIEFANSIGRLL